jgi:hypothetical protein
MNQEVDAADAMVRDVTMGNDSGRHGESGIRTAKRCSGVRLVGCWLAIFIPRLLAAPETVADAKAYEQHALTSAGNAKREGDVF